MPHPKRRHLGAPVSLVLAGLVGALIVPVLAAAPAVAVVGECPPGTLPGPDNDSESWTDNNVAVFAGGDFIADGETAESEGLLVVMGDATFNKSNGGRFNVGWVGVGSQVAPSAGAVMLAVGGNLSVLGTTVLDVGAGAQDAGGNPLGGDGLVGGTLNPDYPSPRYTFNNGSVTSGMGAEAVDQWSSFASEVAQESQDWAVYTTTGTHSVANPRITFTGDGLSSTQVFSIDAASLAGITEVSFTGIPADATVVITVTGGSAITFSPNYFDDNGVRADDPASPLFGTVAQRTMWNFADATSVVFGGSSQFLGSVMAPDADLDITASMNGRVYAGGDIRTHGTGNELHNYPWIGPEFDCVAVPGAEAATGSVVGTKVMGTAGVVAADRLFFGWIECTGGDVVGEFNRRGIFQGGETRTVPGIPLGAQCEVFEDPEYAITNQAPLPAGFMWADPTWRVDGQPAERALFSVTDPDDPDLIEIEATNAVLGRFSVQKVITGPDGGYIGTREFPIDYTCDSVAYDDIGAQLGAGSEAGSLAVAAGASETSAWFPIGTVCTISEATPTTEPGDFAPAHSFAWQTPVITPATVTIGADDAPTIEVTVTNSFAEAESGGFTIEKVVTGSGAPAATFTGTWACELPAGTVVSEGAWSLAAGETTESITAPVGAVCDVDETAPVATDAGTWATPVITGTPLTITADSAEEPLAVVVTNAFTVTAPTPAPGGGGGAAAGDGTLPATGTAVPWWAMGMGILLVVAGAVVLASRRPRGARP